MSDFTPIVINWDRLDPLKLERMADVLRVISHPVRLRIVELLASQPLNVGEIKELIDEEMAHSLISHHLNRMRLMGVLTARRIGATIQYSLAEPALCEIVRCARSCGT
jgi:ArsR family transcriptional regulator